MFHWDSQPANNNSDIAVMTSNPYDNHQPSQPWFNSSNMQIKTEPMEYNSPKSTSQQMSPIIPQSNIDLLDPFRQLGVFNPLTPPGYSGLLFQSSFLSNNHHMKQLTPSKPQDLSNKSSKEMESSITPPMDVTPPKSPTLNDQTPEKDEFIGLETQSESIESYDEMSEFGDEDEGGLEGVESTVGDEKSGKRRKGSNKPRQYKCKQCKNIFHSKTEFWDHVKSHIKPEKMLQCPKCPFVTEYKHHLEYHLRNHSRSKPFQCPHCSYSCVNKSMLNSHLKSHSTVLQYRCMDCNYATKYCHSLKLHLRKYAHKPDIVLNLDGTPNPLPIIDVYGTRRGPKSKATTEKLLAEIEKNHAQQVGVSTFLNLSVIF
jgi:hunchback-like protein